MSYLSTCPTQPFIPPTLLLLLLLLLFDYPENSYPSRQALRPTHHPIQLSPGFFAWDNNAGGMMLTSHLHVPLRIRMSGAITLLPLYALKAYTRTTLICTLLS